MGVVLNLLKSKGNYVLTVRPDQMVKEAIKEMEDIAEPRWSPKAISWWASFPNAMLFGRWCSEENPSILCL